MDPSCCDLLRSALAARNLTIMFDDDTEKGGVTFRQLKESTPSTLLHMFSECDPALKVQQDVRLRTHLTSAFLVKSGGEIDFAALARKGGTNSSSSSNSSSAGAFDARNAPDVGDGAGDRMTGADGDEAGDAPGTAVEDMDE